jgi:DNA-directed RNA polymerase subunit RPC12/RpoP
VTLRSEWGSIDPSTARSRERLTYEEVRRTRGSSEFAVGTLACSRCDAPVAPGNSPRSLTDVVVCPFCSHRALLREFLTLGPPTRPARVVLRVIYPAERLARLG